MSVDQFPKYSALDAACTFEIYKSFWHDLIPTYESAYRMTVNLFPVLMFMQTRGILINRVALEETKVDVLKSAAEKQEELNNLCGRTLNVNSSKDCQKYFYFELGINPYRNKKGGITCDDLALQRLVRGTASRPGLRQAKLVQDIRGLQKLYGTYLNLEFDEDGRIRCSFNPRGSKFGRLSSSKTIFGTGMNFQNLPQEFKKFLVPDPGYCFLEVDKRQAEWVVVAYLTGDANMMAAVESGSDVHVHTARLMFNVPADLVKYEHKLIGHLTDTDEILERRQSDPVLQKFYQPTWPRNMSLRQCGKKSNHGLNYAEGYRQFAMINEIDEKEAKRVVELYHSIYPGIRMWYENIKRMLKRDRTLTNCFGRAVHFLDAWGDDLFKSAYSMLPQSTVVDSLNKGMVDIYNDEHLCAKKHYNLDVLAQVHDSILLQVPIKWAVGAEDFEEILGKIIQYTSPSISYNNRTFQIASDFKIGMNWSEQHEEKNPLGMQDISIWDDARRVVKQWEKLSVSGTARLAD